jgi:hypothetical protein
VRKRQKGDDRQHHRKSDLLHACSRP